MLCNRTMLSAGAGREWLTGVGEATDQMDRGGSLGREDTSVRGSGCRILLARPLVGPSDFQVTCSIEL